MHIAIVRMLGTLKTGMTRDEIVRNLGTESSGDVTECLRELVQCGFVRHCNAIGKAKYGGLYQLVDLKPGKYNGNIMAVVTGEDLFARQVM